MQQCRPSGAFCTVGFSAATLYNLLIEEIRRLPDNNTPEVRYCGEFLERLLARETVPAIPECQEDTVTFSRASSNFSFYRVSNDNGWRRNDPPQGASVPVHPASEPVVPVLSWRRQSAGPPTAKQNLKGEFSRAEFIIAYICCINNVPNNLMIIILEFLFSQDIRTAWQRSVCHDEHGLGYYKPDGEDDPWLEVELRGGYQESPQ